MTIEKPVDNWKLKWKRIPSPHPNQEAFTNGMFTVLREQEKHDGKYWLHVSVCRIPWDAIRPGHGERTGDTPTFFQMKQVWSDFIGDHRIAYQVFPPKDEWVDCIGEPVLHLWSPEGFRPTPDFRALREGKGI